MSVEKKRNDFLGFTSIVSIQFRESDQNARFIKTENQRVRISHAL